MVKRAIIKPIRNNFLSLEESFHFKQAAPKDKTKINPKNTMENGEDFITKTFLSINY